jgi:hypothetical protein
VISAIRADTGCSAAFSGRVWLDIEMANPYWWTDTKANKGWYEALVNECGRLMIDCGVYSSKSQWTEIFGSSSYSYNPQFPLWWAYYDNKKTFSNFGTFGGWGAPYLKQYVGNQNMCGLYVDYNWMP